MTSDWVNHVKKVQKAKGLSYTEAMKVASKSWKKAPKKKAKKGKGSECDRILCKQGIKTNKDFRKWSIKNHPDKGGDQALFQEVSNCRDEIIKRGMVPDCNIKKSFDKEGKIKAPGFFSRNKVNCSNFLQRSSVYNEQTLNKAIQKNPQNKNALKTCYRITKENPKKTFVDKILGRGPGIIGSNPGVGGASLVRF